MRILLPGLALVGYLLLSSSPALAGPLESSRSQGTMKVAENAVKADTKIKYVAYRAGESIPVTLEYSASCTIVFRGLSLWKARPFFPSKVVTGQIANVSGTPMPGQVTNAGSVTFDITFNTLSDTPTGMQSGDASLDLVLGVDKDCDLGTGDRDGIDRAVTFRVVISVSSGSQ